ncbi:MAG: FMN-binding protein [Nocardioides sp.]
MRRPLLATLGTTAAVLALLGAKQATGSPPDLLGANDVGALGVAEPADRAHPHHLRPGRATGSSSVPSTPVSSSAAAPSSASATSAPTSPVPSASASATGAAVGTATATPSADPSASPSSTRPPSTPTPVGSPTPSATTRPSPSPTHPASPSPTPSPSPSPTPSPSPSPRPVTTTGPTISTAYGPVQVQVTTLGKRMTAVKVLQHPSGNPRSDQVNAYALPRLHDEAMAAQSAHIDMVSGATYTSAGYIRSLQAALDRARG